MRLSIITINFNNILGLEKTINSVLSQTYKDYEYIVIDGGSTDGSKELIESYSDKIDYWVSEPDKGIYNAMNKGILKAKGEYLHFLNSGDIYANGNVLQQVFEKKTYKDSLLIGIEIIDLKDYVFRKNIFPDNEVTLYNLYSDSLRHQSTFLKKDLFEKYGLYDENYKIVSDWKLFFTILLNNESIFILNIDIAIFNMDGISSSLLYNELMLQEKQHVINEMLPKTISKDYDKLIHLEWLHNNYVQYYYVIDLIKKNKFPLFCVKTLNKLYKLLKF